MPYLFKKWSKSTKLGKVLSPIILSYALGILICNLNLLPVNTAIAEAFQNGSILLALPLLLYSSDIRSWIKTSNDTLVAFGLCILAGLFATCIATLIFQSQLSNIWQLSGMLTGIYTGGTANLFAIGIALDAPQDDALLLNAAEIFWGAIYLLFLLSGAQTFWNKFLPVGKSSLLQEEGTQEIQDSSISISDVLKAIVLTVLIIGVVVGISFLIFGKLESNFIVIGVTSLGLIASFNDKVRSWNGTYETGDYMLLMFGISIGMMSDFTELMADGGLYIAFVGVVLLLTVVIHGLLCVWRKIDTDTYLITSTAALYSIAFIGQVASALRNRSVIVGGIAVSLIGLAIGTYLGIGVAHIVKAIF